MKNKMKNTNIEKVELLRLVMENNPEIKLSDYMAITKKPERTVCKCLRSTKVSSEKPTVFDDMSMQLIHDALFSSRKVIPRELNRYLGRIKYSAKKWGLSNIEKGKTKCTYSGEKKGNRGWVEGMERYNSISRKYVFEGENVSVSDLEKKLKIPYNTLSTLLRSSNVEQGDDITDLINEKKRTYRSNRKKNQSFVFRGKTISRGNLVNITDISYEQIHRIIHANNFVSGDDVTKAIEENYPSTRIYKPGVTIPDNAIKTKKMYIYNGELLHLSLLAEKSGYSYVTVVEKLHKYGIKTGSDVTTLLSRK